MRSSDKDFATRTWPFLCTIKRGHSSKTIPGPTTQVRKMHLLGPFCHQLLQQRKQAQLPRHSCDIFCNYSSTAVDTAKTEDHRSNRVC